MKHDETQKPRETGIVAPDGNEIIFHGKKLAYDLVKPRLDMVILKLDKVANKSAGGIFLPADPKKDEYFRKATVVRVGPGLFANDGKIVPLDMEPGDRVLIPQHCGLVLDSLKIEDGGSVYAIFKHSDVYAILPEGAEQD